MKPFRHPAGFSLVEVALALGIASFGLLALFGLLPVGISSNHASIEQTNATNIATAIIADLRQTPCAAAIAANPALSSKSPRYGVDVGQSYTAAAPYVFYLDDSGALQPTAATARYKATLLLTQSAAGQRTAPQGSISIGWPAAASSPLDSVTEFTALDRN